MSFLRVKLIEVNFEEGGTMPSDPFCAVKILEVQSQGEGGDPQLIQKKKTFYPQWNRCFDSHLVQGRRMQVIVMDKQVSKFPLSLKVKGEAHSRIVSSPLYQCPLTPLFLYGSHRRAAMTAQWRR